MKFEGRYLISATRKHVWDGLNDTEILKSCIPGCERIVWIDDSCLEATIRVNLGLVKPQIRGRISLSNVRPARAYSLLGEGQGVVLGQARGSADIELNDHAGGSTLEFTARGALSNPVGKIGAKLVSGAAQQVIDRFFERFASRIGATAEPIVASDHRDEA